MRSRFCPTAALLRHFRLTRLSRRENSFANLAVLLFNQFAQRFDFKFASTCAIVLERGDGYGCTAFLWI
jgi:hypothetical protein